MNKELAKQTQKENITPALNFVNRFFLGTRLVGNPPEGLKVAMPNKTNIGQCHCHCHGKCNCSPRCGECCNW